MADTVEGETFNVFCETVNCRGISSLLAAPTAVISIFPGILCGVVRPLVLMTVTWKLAGEVLLAVPLAGETLNEELPDVTAAFAVTEPEVIDTVNVCGFCGVTEPPIV